MSEEAVNIHASLPEPFVSAQMITKSFQIGTTRIDVLKGVTLSAKRGEWLALTGASGSGDAP